MEEVAISFPYYKVATGEELPSQGLHFLVLFLHLSRDSTIPHQGNVSESGVYLFQANTLLYPFRLSPTLGSEASVHGRASRQKEPGPLKDCVERTAHRLEHCPRCYTSAGLMGPQMCKVLHRKSPSMAIQRLSTPAGPKHKKLGGPDPVSHFAPQETVPERELHFLFLTFFS